MSEVANIPLEPYLELFWHFLKFGLLAWGGPAAQIAMVRQELMDEEQRTGSGDIPYITNPGCEG